MADHEYNFQDRMTQGKELAHERRQRGMASGTKPAQGWVYQRAVGDHDEWFAAWRTRWISDCYEIQRQYRKATA